MIFLPVTELARLAHGGGVLFFIGIKFLPGCPDESGNELKLKKEERTM